MDLSFMAIPPGQLEIELHEKNMQLKSLEQKVESLRALVAAGRNDEDFDLFCRRVQLAEIFSKLPTESLMNFHLEGFYSEFWYLVNQSQRVTKFSGEEEHISQKLIEKIKKESDPIRRQYLVLTLVLFGKFVEIQDLMEQKFWPRQLRDHFTSFIRWNRISNTAMPLQTRQVLLNITQNEQSSAFFYDMCSEIIKKHSQDVINEQTCPKVSDYQIYFCWFQGEDSLPPIVRCCYNSLRQNAGNYKVVFIDEKNFLDYVDIAPHVMDKFRSGKISRTHLSDILRINLLERHGGLWLDATILVTDPLENHKDILEKHFFSQKFDMGRSYKNKYPNNVSFGRWATFIQGTSIIHNPLFVFEKECFNEYLKKFDHFVRYALQDFVINLAYENIPCVKKEIDDVPINNLEVRAFQRILNTQYKNGSLDNILRNNFLFKTSWKADIDTVTEGTVFKEIQKRYAPETLE